jgi:UDP-glucose 4-epimerase
MRPDANIEEPDILNRRTLVTGGAGFIGTHLVRRLLESGEEVTVLDDMSGGGTGMGLPAAARFVRGDVRDRDLVADLASRADGIIHLAALVSVQSCISNWSLGHQINLSGTMNVLHAAQQAGNLPIVYASSAAVYGDLSGQSCHENMRPRPISPYAADKLACEHQAQAMAHVFGVPSVGLRFFNIYGPLQDARSPYAGVISRFCANRLSNAPHTVFGDGLQSRDFVHVSDVVEGLIRARDMADGSSSADVYNICTGNSTTLLQLAATIDGIAGQGATQVVHAPARAGDIRESRGDPSLAREQLGFVASIDIIEGLRDLWSTLDEGAAIR